jgi:hypothetical protein
MTGNTLVIPARFSCHLKAHELEELDDDAIRRTWAYHFHHEDCQTSAIILASRAGVAD